MKVKNFAMGATALVIGAAGFANAGHAYSGTAVYGLGSSLVAPYARQEFDCYGKDADLYVQNSTKTNPPVVQDPAPFIYNGKQCTSYNPITGAGAPPLAAPYNSAAQLNYESTGSGTGIKGLYAHDATQAGALPSTGNTPWPAAPLGVQFGFAETSLDSTDVSIYNSGDTSGAACTTTTNEEHVGLCVVPPGVTPGSGQVANPSQYYGALIQIPMLITPVDIAFNPVYETVLNADSSTTTYKFNIYTKYQNKDGSGGLHLDVTALCNIFNGGITNWNDASLKTLNGGKSLEDPTDPTPATSWSVPLQIVGRSDSSGTTSVFTRHLAAVCGSVTYENGASNQYTAVTTTLPSALQGPVYTVGSGGVAPTGTTPGKFVRAGLSSGVAEFVGLVPAPTSTSTPVFNGRIGYVGPDYALPAVTLTKATPIALEVANLQNALGAFVEPSAKAATAAFAAQLPPQSDANGNYVSGDTANGLRSDPSAWVQGTTTSSYLANPQATGSYPITGTSNMILYTCYANKNLFGAIKGYLAWYNANPEVISTNGILSEAGLAYLPKAWRVAIKNTFLTPVANTKALDLNIGVAQAASTPQCDTAGIIGG
jgi:ABC-type phosphate transport system substrate-binding protein